MAGQVGRIEKGFDFLGYHFNPEGLSVAKVSIQRFAERIVVRLYEARQSLVTPFERSNRIPDNVSHYVQRWLKWVRSGLNNYALSRLTDNLKVTYY